MIGRGVKDPCAAGALRSERASGPLLDLHKAVSHPDPQSGRCERWPENLWLMDEASGEMVRGRCRASNLCAYCARLFAVETSEMLALDALAGNAPQLWAVLTTRTATLDTKAFYRGRELVQRAIRRRWPGAEFAWFLEFTTGYGSASYGRRRPHWNLLVKGVPADSCALLRSVLTRVWCAHVDALPQAQYVGTITASGGLMKYLALHFQKESQQPPKGWRGHRLTSTRGYFAQGRPAARKEARRSLQLGREIWRLGPDLEADDALELATAALDAREARSFRLVHAWPCTRTPRGGSGSRGNGSPESPAICGVLPPLRVADCPTVPLWSERVTRSTGMDRAP
jgi:hypothetical protein